MKSEIIQYDITDIATWITSNRTEATNDVKRKMGKKLTHAPIIHEDRVTVYACRQVEGRIRMPEPPRAAGCGRASFNRKDGGTYDGFADDLFLAQTGW